MTAMGELRTVAARRLFQNSEVIYCAESLDQAWELFEADTGETRADNEYDPFEEMPSNEPLEICFEDEPTDEPTRTLRKRGKYDYWFVSKLVREWAAESRVGHFCGGDY